MKAIIALAATAVLLGGAAAAQPPGPPATTICLEAGGHQQPATCQYMVASRINRREDICQCLSGGQPISVALCPAGLKPPADSAVYERERYAAVQNGSLVGASWRGRPICVAPHEQTGG